MRRVAHRSELSLVQAERGPGGGATERHYLDFAADGRPLRTASTAATSDLISGLWLGSTEPGHSTLQRLLGESEPDAPHGRVTLYVCPECADLGCGAITVVLTINDATVTWRDWGYQNNYEDGVSPIDRVGTISFDAVQYRQLLSDVRDSMFAR